MIRNDHNSDVSLITEAVVWDMTTRRTHILTDLVCGYWVNKEGLSAGVTPQWKSQFGSTLSQWHLLGLAVWVWGCTCVSITVCVHVQTVLCVQNVKTGSLFTSQRSCLLSYIDAIVELGQTWLAPTWTVYQPCLLFGKGQSDTVGEKNTKLTVDHKSVIMSPTRIYHTRMKLIVFLSFASCPVSRVSAFHLMLADSYERVRRRGGAGRVCV